MRLLNSRSLELEEFPDDRIPRYAILSHRWQDDEVSFQDMQSGGTAIKKAGYPKLKMCCELAFRDGLGHAWIDTCCIDKTSSAELSEAINSMYGWYQNAAVCYVYLFDVHSMAVPVDESFSTSTWFTRGWTLQELIAPENVEFYNSTWHKLGTKHTLEDTISIITNIDVKALQGTGPEHFSIAKKMSWVSNRTTTRVEDIAYSMLGLFGVHMPLLYGEGPRAFIRLQEEIMKQSDDHSIFAWTSTDNTFRGLLARSPADFRDCSNIVISSSRLSRTPYSIKNMGLKITLPLIAWEMDTYLVGLDCELESSPDNRIGIFLRALPEEGQYARLALDGRDNEILSSHVIRQNQFRKIYVQQKIWGSLLPMDRIYGFWLRSFPSDDTPPGEHSDLKVTAWNRWNATERILKIPTGESGTAGVLQHKYNFVPGRAILKFGFDPMFNPVCQYGGPIHHNSTLAIVPEPNKDSFGFKMEAGWMTQKSSNIFRGDRLRGLDFNDGIIRISIADEVIQNRRVWVVDIAQPQRIVHEGIACDGCNQVSLGWLQLLSPLP
jgi:hypothetical protein